MTLPDVPLDAAVPRFLSMYAALLPRSSHMGAQAYTRLLQRGKAQLGLTDRDMAVAMIAYRELTRKEVADGKGQG